MALLVKDEPDPGRYVVEVDDELAGFSEYHLRGDNIYFFVHTVILPAYQGQGVGIELASQALTDVKSKGGRVVPICPYIAEFIRTHPEYDELVEHKIWDRIKAGGDKSQ